VKYTLPKVLFCDKINRKNEEGGVFPMAHKIGPECIGCGACAGGCPTGCIKEDGGVYVINAGECIDCGSCVGNCPTGAIKAE
jgi:ferredoxin